MPQKPLSDEILQQTKDAVDLHGSINAAADAIGVPRATMHTRVSSARNRGFEIQVGLIDSGPVKRLSEAGYDLDAAEMTPEQAWDCGDEETERTIAEMLRRQWRKLKRKKGPGVIAHITDAHLDDPGTVLRLLKEDIQKSHDLDAIMCSGGDVLNNWPEAGRLAKKHAEQQCTLSMGLLRAQHYIDLMQPDVWVDGNHEEMARYLTDLLHGWLPKKTISDYWACNFVIETPGGRDVRCILSHKFDKGSSWFHKAHGHIREMLEGQEADVLMDGHLHSDGVLDHTLPERGHSALCVASAGYKMVDKFARRISKGGNSLKIRGRAHWIVYNPQAEFDQSLAVAWKSPEEAEIYLNGLQNLVTV